MIRMKKLREFIVWSNVFYLVPLGAAVYWTLWPVAVAVAALTYSSTGYHLGRRQQFAQYDTVSSYTVALLCAAMLFLTTNSSDFFPMVLVAGAAAMYVRIWLDRPREHPYYHGWWHILAAAVILLSIMNFGSTFRFDPLW